MLLLRSLAFNVAFYAWTVALTLATLPFYFFVSQERSMDVVRLWTRGASWLLKAFLFLYLSARFFKGSEIAIKPENFLKK